MDRLDKSLDDLAKESRKKSQDERKKKDSKKDAPNKKDRPVKANSDNRGAKAKPAKTIRLAQPTAQAFARNVRVDRSDLASRLGRKVTPGTAVIFSNMNFNITQTDIRELCATVGPIGPRIFMKPNAGNADVMFDQKYDAIQAVKRFNNLTLDGRPMKVFLKDSNQGQAGAPALNQSRNAGRMGGREMFGTRQVRGQNSSATFSVNMSGVVAPKAKKVVKDKVKVVKERAERKEKPKREKRENAAPADPAQLDADMDSYFADRAKKEEA